MQKPIPPHAYDRVLRLRHQKNFRDIRGSGIAQKQIDSRVDRWLF
ncbi:MAG: hypothetical protein QY323_02030 [Patescibacteria group bacterium]|nr:MAG: hypothetical protein QY323_02030 [Patescibacteria group bacterium]